jgi:hypothetical protein
MSTAIHADEKKHGGPDSPTPEEIAVQLHEVLSSPVFSGSKRCRQFLDYVCARSLAGDTGALKERSIAIEVFGRHPDTAGQGEDTIVRVGAREVRKRLAQYYVTPEGSSSPIVIELPSGSYAPEFRYAVASTPRTAMTNHGEAEPEAPSEVPAPEAGVAAPTRKRSYRTLIAVVAIAVVAIVGAAALLRLRPADPRTAAFDRFWSPVLHSSEPLLIGVGHPLVYQPSHRATALNEKRLAPAPFPMQRPLDLPPGELNGSDMVPVLNQYVGFGDMVAANEVSQMLARHSCAARLMLASSIPFAELRQSQAYLIGSVSNHWTMELGQNWRFRFDWTEGDHQPEFVDTQSVPRRAWTVSAHDDGSVTDDYSLICRIRNSPTGQLLIVSAGIKQFGTEAAGRILADPAALGAILNQLPAGWEEKNLQVVLHMKVIGNTPAQPEVVASHVW